MCTNVGYAKIYCCKMQIQNYSRWSKSKSHTRRRKNEINIAAFTSDQMTQRSSYRFIKACLQIFQEKFMTEQLKSN